MTQRMFGRGGAACLLTVALAMIASVWLAAPAHAQIAQQLGKPQVLQDANLPKKQAAPPALPGSKPSEAAAPSDKPATDMAPNEALFDAINRGDLGGAKDALSRGADLDAHNVLGATPLELSVDLGRNDITFVLLSMRNGGGPRPSVASGGTPPGARTPSTAAADAAAAKAAARAARVTRQVAAAPAAPPQRPQLFAGSGGTPVPQAGFLGFNNGSTP